MGLLIAVFVVVSWTAGLTLLFGSGPGVDAGGGAPAGSTGDGSAGARPC